MAEPTVFGLFGLAAFLAVLGLNVGLIWRHADRLVSALGFAEARGQLIRLRPGGDDNVVRLRPGNLSQVTRGRTTVRLAA